MENENSEHKIPLEQKKLEEAAENLKNIQFSGDNYKELLEIINRISSIAGNKKHEEEIERSEVSETIKTEKVSENNSIPEADETAEENSPTPPKDSVNQEAVVFGKTVLPSFAIMTGKGLRNYSNAIVERYAEESNSYILNDGKEKIVVPAKTFESIMSPNTAYTKDKNIDNLTIADESPAIVNGKTILPEFAIITTTGLQTFKNLTVQNYNEAEKSYTLSDGNKTVTLPESSFLELTKPARFERQFDDKTPAHKKLLETQYEQYFKDRDNTANNFRHNLSVHCRKECSSPLDALKAAKEITSRMSREEQQKTRNLLKQLAREDETINQVIIRTYFEAIKEVPLNENYIKQNFPEKKIARPFYDTISNEGALVDKDSTLRIGDTLHDIAFNVDKILGHGKEQLYETLTVVSASKEGNSVLLMDKNKSFYEVPRDTLLENYNKQQLKEHHAERHQQKANRIEIER